MNPITVEMVLEKLAALPFSAIGKNLKTGKRKVDLPVPAEATGQRGADRMDLSEAKSTVPAKRPMNPYAQVQDAFKWRGN